MDYYINTLVIVPVSNALCLGKKADRPKLLKVTTPDLTPLEQKTLRQKLAEMNKYGKTHKIKNGVIVQRA